MTLGEMKSRTLYYLELQMKGFQAGPHAGGCTPGQGNSKLELQGAVYV